MSADRILLVEDTFEITDRGVVVAPMLLDLGLVAGQEISVELRRPDGTTLLADARVEAVWISPWRPEITSNNALRFPRLRAIDIPIGTEIWMRTRGGP